MFNLYENIKELCEAHGITVSRMCEDVQISKSTLSNLKNGRSETISPATAKKIAQYLGVSEGRVLHGALYDFAVEKSQIEQFAKMPVEMRERLLNISDLNELVALDPNIKEAADLMKKAPITNEQLKFALWGDTSNITDADLEDVLNFAAYIKQKREREGSK